MSKFRCAASVLSFSMLLAGCDLDAFSTEKDTNSAAEKFTIDSPVTVNGSLTVNGPILEKRPKLINYDELINEIAESPRLASIATNQMQIADLVNFDTPLWQFMNTAAEALKQDHLNAKLYSALSQAGADNEIRKVASPSVGWMIRNDWFMPVQESSRYLTSLPDTAFMVMPYETIPYPRCEEESTPVLFYAMLAATKTSVSKQEDMPKISEVKVPNGWYLKIDDMPVQDPTQFNFRFFVELACSATS